MRTTSIKRSGVFTGAALVVALGGVTVASVGAAASTEPGEMPEHEGSVVFSGPSGGFADALGIVFEKFTAETGIEVEYIEALVSDTFANMQTQHDADDVQIDVGVISPRDLPLGARSGLFAELDPELVPTLSEIAPFATSQPGGVGFAFSPDGIAYNVGTFEENGWEAPTSWTDLWDPTYASCAIPLHPSTSSTAWGMLNYVASDGDYAAFDAAFEHFDAIADDVPAVATSPIDALDLLQQDIGCITSASQARALSLLDDNIGFVLPEEGASVGVISLALADGAPHPVAAQMLIDWILQPESQLAIVEGPGQSSVNPNTPESTTELGSQLAGADDFDSEGFHVVPAEAYDDFGDWIRTWDLRFGS